MILIVLQLMRKATVCGGGLLKQSRNQKPKICPMKSSVWDLFGGVEVRPKAKGIIDNLVTDLVSDWA